MASPPDRTLEDRIARIEDFIEITQVMSAYGPAADATHWEQLTEILSQDCVFENSSIPSYEGHAGLKEMFAAPFHHALVEAGSGHVSSPPHVVLDGDRASATGHFMLYQHQDGAYPVIRLVAMRYELARNSGRWQITKRTAGLLDGSERGVSLLRRAAEGPSN